MNWRMGAGSEKGMVEGSYEGHHRLSCIGGGSEARMCCCVVCVSSLIEDDCTSPVSLGVENRGKAQHVAKGGRCSQMLQVRALRCVREGR